MARVLPCGGRAVQFVSAPDQPGEQRERTTFWRVLQHAVESIFGEPAAGPADRTLALFGAGAASTTRANQRGALRYSREQVEEDHRAAGEWRTDQTMDRRRVCGDGHGRSLCSPGARRGEADEYQGERVG